MKNGAYDDALDELALELVGMARWARAKGERIVVVFEGRDTAGKGGAIKAIHGRLDPRQCRIAALPKPSEDERTQWYFQRYTSHLPAAGEIVLFDRSWYNRAGVERVMGWASERQVAEFLRAAPIFEKMLVDDGIRLFKYWLSASQESQEERFRERLDDPLKRWKLSPTDVAARAKYADYTAAREAIFAATHTAWAPWTVVNFNDQKRGRLTLIRHLLDRLPDTHVEPEPIDWPDLGHDPLTEEFGVLSPIPDFPDGE
ncbi:polyphosphate kinase 2 [Croceicoccus naphthovorans]|uniref:ADP/GDP-polyphosphate phosphotransferase n=1 Tax=Croceicoccus naphthovorans TaxID=1348774 RepID=A0A0G3XFD4_9SPHN|nr:polyphosphate kinase 2 [Croceicoccus naphthovorans]AKM10235.1 polyphosphate kinase [Croceicoccus naphthovorans]MBB3990499.1 polyphosphate kinase 2 [Croceicoccus naphthovorans]